MTKRIQFAPMDLDVNSDQFDDLIHRMTPEQVHIHTIADAQELLSKFSLEDVRQLWENGAFVSPLPSEVKSYFVKRFIEGDL
jgi:hypothetical protein